MFAAFAVYFVVLLRKTISPPLILTYALLEGLFIGAISQYYNQAYNGRRRPGRPRHAGAFAAMLVGVQVRPDQGQRQVPPDRDARHHGLLFVSLGSLVASLFGVGARLGLLRRRAARHPALRRGRRRWRPSRWCSTSTPSTRWSRRGAGEDLLDPRLRPGRHAGLALHRAAPPAVHPAQQLAAASSGASTSDHDSSSAGPPGAAGELLRERDRVVRRLRLDAARRDPAAPGPGGGPGAGRPGRDARPATRSRVVPRLAPYAAGDQIAVLTAEVVAAIRRRPSSRRRRRGPGRAGPGRAGRPARDL